MIRDADSIDRALEKAASWDAHPTAGRVSAWPIIISADQHGVYVVGDGANKWLTRDELSINEETHHRPIPGTYEMMPLIWRWTFLGARPD